MKAAGMALMMSLAAAPAFAAEERVAITAAGPLDQFASEPSVREVQEAAMRYALVADDVLNGYQAAAKWSKVLPRTRVRYREDTDDNTGVTINEVGERDISLDDDKNQNYEVQL